MCALNAQVCIAHFHFASIRDCATLSFQDTHKFGHLNCDEMFQQVASYIINLVKCY